MAGEPSFSDDFDTAALDTEVWLPHYLPQWSSRAESAATYAVRDSELRLTIPPEQGLWCARDHEPPLRVSGVQSGVFSGEVGSTAGQQLFRDGLVVREAIDAGGAAVGMGVHPFRDPAQIDDFAAPRLPIDVTHFHVFGADWRPGRVDFFVDGDHVRTVEQAPDYPMQMMIGVFDFPAKPSAAEHAGHVPRFVLDHVRGA